MIIFKKENLYPAMPCAACTKEGEILVVFRCAPREKRGYTHLHSLSTIMLTRSIDRGATWSQPEEIARKDLLAKQDPHLFIADDGTILLYYFRYLFHPESELPSIENNRNLVYLHAKKKHAVATLRGLGITVSTDGGRTFTDPRPVSLPGVPSCAVRGRAVQLANDRILLATYARKQDSRYCIDIIASEDRGESWYLYTENVVSTKRRKGIDTEYVEPSLLLDPGGRLHLFARTHEGDERAYTSRCYSDDSGASFSGLRKTPVSGFPLDPCMLSNKRVFISYGWRESKPYGVRYRIGTPDVSDLGKAEEIRSGRSSSTPDCGYPWAVQLDNETVLLVHYRCDSRGVRSIEGELISL